MGAPTETATTPQPNTVEVVGVQEAVVSEEIVPAANTAAGPAPPAYEKNGIDTVSGMPRSDDPAQ